MPSKVWSPADFQTPIRELPLVAFDLEASGAYPIREDIVEFAGVRWENGQVTATYQTLLKPKQPMSDFIIGIHGITNEMVTDAPLLKDKIVEIRDFLAGAVAIAHHAPFDLGFLTAEFERHGIVLPNDPAVCTSLLSRAVIPESPNHRLQTLIPFLGLKQGTAHRALSDTEACLELAFKCFDRMGGNPTLQAVMDKVGKPLDWVNFSLGPLASEKVREIRRALENGYPLDIVYDGGTLKGKTRRVTPEGLVRNPDGDYLVAVCHVDRSSKRFYLQKIQDLSVVPSPEAALSVASGAPSFTSRLGSGTT